MDEVEFVDVQKICVLQCSALITTYIDMCIYIYIFTQILIQYACITLHYTFVDAYANVRKTKLDLS